MCPNGLATTGIADGRHGALGPGAVLLGSGSQSVQESARKCKKFPSKEKEAMIIRLVQSPLVWNGHPREMA